MPHEGDKTPAQDNSQRPAHTSAPPPLPPSPRRPAPHSRSAPRPAQQADWSVGALLRMGVTIALWSAVLAGLLLVFVLGTPRSVEGLLAKLLSLAWQPLAVLVGIAGLGGLLHGLWREGIDALSQIHLWLLLAALALLLWLYPQVGALRQLLIL